MPMSPHYVSPQTNVIPVTVGRDVHYIPIEGRLVVNAAKVTYVHDNDTVDLYVMGVGECYHRFGVKYSTELEACTWRWPARV